MRSFLYFLAIVMVLLGGSCAHAQSDPIFSRGALDDPSGELTIEQVVKRAFSPAKHIVARGRSASALWIRIDVRPSSTGTPLELNILPRHLDRIELYEPRPNANGGWRRSVTGWLTPLAERQIASTNLGFTIWPEGPSTTYYLRITSKGNIRVAVDALDLSNAKLHDARSRAVDIIYLGIIFSTLLVAIGAMARKPDSVIGSYIGALIVYWLYNFAMMGYVVIIVPGSALPTAVWFSRCLIPLAVLAWMGFHRTLLCEYAPRRSALRLLDGLIFIEAISLFLMLYGDSINGLLINDYGVLLLGPLLPAISFTARQDAALSRKTLALAYAFLALPTFFIVASTLQFEAASEWSLLAERAYGLLSTAIIFAILSIYSRTRDRRAAEDAVQLELTRRELEVERGRLDTQHRFMAMLTHEVKTPLSTIAISLGAITTAPESHRLIEMAVDDMNGIIERCRLSDRLEQQTLPVTLSQSELSALVVQAVRKCPAAERINIDISELPKVLTDEDLLSIVLSNLLDNAAKYSLVESAISVSAQAQTRDGRDGVMIAVDNAPGRAGLPDQKRVFTKYYRSPGAQRNSGSGLGLYIVHGLVSNMLSGAIVCTTAENRVRFEIWLPC